MKPTIRIMKQQPEMSDEEVRSFMDFEGLMRRRNEALQQARPDYWKWVIPAILLVGTGLGVVLVRHDSTPVHPASPAPVAQPAAPQPATAEQQHTSHAAGDSSMVAIAPATRSTPLKKHQPDVPVSASTPSVQEVIKPVYLQAEPADGYAVLYEYFHRSLVYPAEAVKDSVQGVITVSFVLNTAGAPENIQVAPSLGAPFDREARRLIENMPPWKPATLNGKPVASKISLPLTFQLHK